MESVESNEIIGREGEKWHLTKSELFEGAAKKRPRRMRCFTGMMSELRAVCRVMNERKNPGTVTLR